MKHYYPSFDEFLKLAEKGNTIPVHRLLLADSLTPVTAYQRLDLIFRRVGTQHLGHRKSDVIEQSRPLQHSGKLHVLFSPHRASSLLG